MAFPYAVEAISWKMYMINGGWDVLQVIYIAFCWVETKGKTLEEIDGLFVDPNIVDAVTVTSIDVADMEAAKGLEKRMSAE